MLDHFGRGFVLLRFGDAPPAVDALVDAAAAAGMPLRVLDVRHAAAEQLYERRLVLVRPDGSVAWRADEAPSDPARLVDTIRGMYGPAQPAVAGAAYQLAEV